MRLAEEAGVAAIGFHPRSAATQHKGEPDYALARELAERDRCAGDHQRRPRHRRGRAPRAYEESGADAVMIARGSLGNPWIFEELTGRRTSRRPATEMVAELLWVIDRAEEHMGPERAARYLRKFYPWYLERLERRPRAAAALQRSDDLDAGPRAAWSARLARTVACTRRRCPDPAGRGLARRRRRRAGPRAPDPRLPPRGERPGAAAAARLPLQLLRLAAAAGGGDRARRRSPSTASASGSPTSRPTTTTRWACRPTSPRSWSRRHAPDRPVFIVGHDMGTSVATELMARDIDGALRLDAVPASCSSTAR